MNVMQTKPSSERKTNPPQSIKDLRERVASLTKSQHESMRSREETMQNSFVARFIRNVAS